ncbi:MAG: four helix bundle protein [Bacteroidetes bacterium]|nr:four helix bundle protein [Bacteroidota bacterium]MBS1592351.1 four helix bundle protein [Bacteroidota bacterium]MBS1639706.1 four helix bundle protein [Bacteroidota bacterium]
MLRVKNFTNCHRSLLEVVGCLFLAKRRNYVTEDDFNKLYLQIETLVKMIQTLINSLND